jgi:hypothetical protein
MNVGSGYGLLVDTVRNRRVSVSECFLSGFNSFLKDMNWIQLAQD